MSYETGWAPGHRSFVFDETVADTFERMLEDSIPGYADMRQLVAAVAGQHLTADGTVVDLGASKGGAVETLTPAQLVLVERSEAMRAHLHERYPHAEILDLDLRYDYPSVSNVDVVLAVLTLQFVPIEHRQRVVADAAASLRPGGALIVVEKVLGSDARADRMIRALHDEHKRGEGRTDEDIARNLLALEGVLVPVTAAWNEDLLQRAGLSVECFWRHANFAAWVATAS